MKKILCVIRTSTERQETESQKVEMLSFITLKGYKENEIEWIEVAGASARKLNKKYLAMIESIKSTILSNPTIKSCALWHLNRLGRVDDVLIQMKNWFITNHIQLYVKNPSITLFREDGTVDGGAEIAFGVFATMVKQDTQELFEKFQRGKQRNSRNGKYNGGNKNEVMFGYMVNEEGYIVPNPEESEIVNTIFKMYASGKYSIIKLMRELSERGITYRGRKLTHTVIARCIKNTAYIGYTNNESRHTKRTYIPIIDKDLWKKVKQIRERNIRVETTKESKNKHFAIGILKCQYCGHNYVADQNRTYTCYVKKAGYRENKKCEESTSVNLLIMDACLWHTAKTIHTLYLQQVNTANLQELQNKANVLQTKINVATNNLEGMSVKYERIGDLYADGVYNKQKYQSKKAQLDAEKDGYETTIKELQKQLAQTSKMIEDLSKPQMDDGMMGAMDIIMEIEREDNHKQKHEIIHRHIDVAHITRESIDDKFTYTVITITTKIGKIFKYAYRPHSNKLFRYNHIHNNWIVEDFK